jgi:EpsI family protein
MTSANAASGDPASPSTRRWAVAGAVAAAVFLLLEAVDGFVAVQLREVSSAIVGAVLGALGFPVTRQGTILITPNVRFDVVPACSGSTTLRVLLFVVIVWCGIHPRLTFPRRLLAAVLALPLAILANSVRVSALVVAGHLAGEEPGGFFHGAAGVLAFVLAMVGGFTITDALATDAKPKVSGGRAWLAAQAGLLAFLAAPFAYWCARGWGNPLDRFGWVPVGLAAGAAAWSAVRAPTDRSRDGLGTALFAGSLLILLGATVADVNILKGMALLGALLSAALATKGPRFLRSMLPVAAVAYLGFPTTSYQLQAVTVPLFGAGNVAASLGTKTVLALLLGGAWFLPAFRPPVGAATPAPAPRSRWAPARLSLLAALTALQGYYFSVGANAVELQRLEMSYLQGDWEGRSHDPGVGKDEFFEGRIWSRRYARGPQAVDVVVTSTGGDRHRAHPPAYCLTGDGWTVASESRIERALGDGRTVPMTRMVLRKDGREMAFSFWFSDGTGTRASYRDMLTEDTLRRLAGRRTDWFLFRVMTELGEPVLDEFLTRFAAGLTKAP